MQNDPQTSVLQALQGHIGKGNGISVKQLEAQLGMTPRTIRSHVSALRDEGLAICGTPKAGYFIAATQQELEDTCEFLHSRALHSLGLEAKLRRIPLPDLIGQLHLPT